MIDHDCKHDDDIKTLYGFRASDRELITELKTKVNFICVITLVIFTAVAGQIVLSLSKERVGEQRYERGQALLR